MKSRHELASMYARQPQGQGFALDARVQGFLPSINSWRTRITS